MSRENVEVVRRLLDALARRDAATVLALSAEYTRGLTRLAGLEGNLAEMADSLAPTRRGPGS
jgi:hypothetical protein